MQNVLARQDGGGGGRGGGRGGGGGRLKEKEGPCILLLFSLFLPGWAISRPPVFNGWGLVGGLSVSPLGSVCNILRYRTLWEGG